MISKKIFEMQFLKNVINVSEDTIFVLRLMAIPQRRLEAGNLMNLQK